MKEFITHVIRQAGQATMRHFGKARIEYTKENENDVVTQADLESQRILVRAIQKQYPSHGIIAEEENVRYQTNAEYVWYIDPLDGTRNFATRVPLFGLNMGLAHKGQMCYGAIYLPVTDELCFAEAGQGAFLNDRKIHCSLQRDWKQSYGIGSARIASFQGISFLNNIATISEKSAWVSCVGSVAVAAVYLADGRRDWYVSSGSKVWDYAAPSIILKEAGCKVTNSYGGDWQPGDEDIVVANEYLHETLLHIMV